MKTIPYLTFSIGMILGTVITTYVYTNSIPRPAISATKEIREHLQKETQDPKRFLSFPVHTYPCTINKVIDGDTYDITLTLWEGLQYSTRIRLLDCDTPELRPRTGTEAERQAEKEKAKQATDFVKRTFEKTNKTYFQGTGETGSFGRALGTILYENDSGTMEDIRRTLKENNLLKD